MPGVPAVHKTGRGDDGRKKFKHLNGTKVKDPTKAIALISINEDVINEDLGSVFLYVGAETIYHEMMAHVEGSTGDETQDHIDYGLNTEVNNKGELTITRKKNSPAYNILIQLFELAKKKKDNEAANIIKRLLQ